MIRGRLLAIAGCGFAAVALVAGCASQEKKRMESLNQPINCATAEGDLRVLQSEKKNVADQIAQGVTEVSRDS